MMFFSFEVVFFFNKIAEKWFEVKIILQSTTLLRRENRNFGENRQN